MLTQKDAKTMAKSLRDALGNRNVLLSHSECLEIVARQLGLSDWNTLATKLPSEAERNLRVPGPNTGSPLATSEVKSIDPADGVAAPQSNDEVRPATQTAAPWTTCSFCGKSRPEVQIMLGGCGGWEGFRARRNPESGERSNVFICNECVALCARITADASVKIGTSLPA